MHAFAAHWLVKVLIAGVGVCVALERRAPAAHHVL
jgi:hypothetical protein